MRLMFLGTGGYHPNRRRETAGLLLPEWGVAFDAGTSAYRLQAAVTGRELQIFLTHAHLDHICGLTYLLVPMLRGDWSRVTVHGTTATLAAVRAHLFSEPVFPVLPQFEWSPLQAQHRLPGGTLSHVALTHPGGSIGYRVDRDDGRSLAYITDTVTDGRYLDLIRDVDVLIHECYFPDALAEWCTPTGHSHTSAVAEVARMARVKQLWLTHIDPQRPDDDPIDLAAARRVFPETFLAEDELTIDW